MEIPIIDLADFLNGDAARKTEFVNRLGNAYEHIGFVAVSNHGIAEPLIDELYEYSKQFFALQSDTKLKYERPELSGQRGYTSFGTEHAKGSEAPDLKEFFQFGQIPGDNVVSGEQYPENVFVQEVPEFTPTMLQAYKAFEKTGTLLLQAIALFLNLDEHYFDKYVTNGNSILRAIYYPPIIQEPASAIRSEQHEDINLITLLVGSSAEGLQVLSMQGEWIPVTSLPGQIVVNVGDMLQRLTNDRLKSTTHRVINPPREKWHTARYSIPFFLHPESNMSLACLPTCVDKDHPKSYTDYTAGQYLDERLVEIGLKKK